MREGFRGRGGVAGAMAHEKQSSMASGASMRLRWGIENACYSQTGKASKNMAWRKGEVSLIKIKKTI